jgi:hypothetical protein
VGAHRVDRPLTALSAVATEEHGRDLATENTDNESATESMDFTDQKTIDTDPCVPCIPWLKEDKPIRG